VFEDGVVIAKRNVIKIKRVPEVLMFVLVSPIMFVLLFAYIFGSAIDIPGGSYREFLIGGIFAQTVIFGATFTGAGLAEDMQKGIINRFRSLPMSPSAVVVGRTASDVVYNTLTLIIMALTGLLVGWRINNGFWNAVLAFGLLLLFAYAFSWIMALVGLVVPSVEVINNASFVVIFPLTFIANTFVPVDDFPAILRTFAEWNPVSTLTQAVRELFGNIPPGTPEPTAWPLANPVIYSLIWVGIILIVFIPLSIRQYQRATAKG
jgi:ABC transporter DrrB family efflux protein